MSTSAIANGASAAAREVAPWLERLARLGFVAKALLYVTIGVLATLAALRLGGSASTGSRGAMATLFDAPFGRVLLVVIAIGLFGYAAWRIVQGIADPEHNGHDAKGLAKRARAIGTGVVHAALAVSAIKVVSGDWAAASDGQTSQSWTARALSSTGGTIVLWLVAGAFVGYGLYQLYRAWRAKLNKQLALGRMGHTVRKWVIAGSRFGIAARGVVFVTIGVLISRAIQQHDPSEARGVSQAMLELFQLGRAPFIIIATGLVAYGLYQLINARYRRIDVA